MTHCDDCGTKLDRGGICPNCDEELFIVTFQGDDFDYPMSDEFTQAIEDGTARAKARIAEVK